MTACDPFVRNEMIKCHVLITSALSSMKKKKRTPQILQTSVQMLNAHKGTIRGKTNRSQKKASSL